MKKPAALEHIPLNYHPNPSSEELIAHSEQMLQAYRKRRSCRFFSDKDVPEELIQNLIGIAGSAPSGANKQPWYFVAVRSQELKDKIREAAEAEEKLFYEERATEEWLKDLAPLGTDWEKPFLSIAPWLIIVFKELYGQEESGEKVKHYYVNESVGLASGFLISAIHHLGLTTLTHTPSPMNFLANILGRPSHQKPFLLLPVGYPAEDATVPNIEKKGLDEISEIL